MGSGRPDWEVKSFIQGGNIEISGTPEVEISGTPAVTIDGDVTIGGTPTITVESGNIITTTDNFEMLKINVTAADSSSEFAQKVKSVLIYNDGPNACHVNFDAAATTSKFKIPSKSYMVVDLGLTTPHFICAAGETSTIYVTGTW